MTDNSRETEKAGGLGSNKGKGKASAADQQTGASNTEKGGSEPQGTNTLASRIAASASGLAKDAFSSQATRSATSELASSSSAVGEKMASAGPSSAASTSQWTQDSRVEPAARAGQSGLSVQDQQNFREAGSFEGQGVGNSTVDAFNEFQSQRTVFSAPTLASRLPDENNGIPLDRNQNWGALFARSHGADILDETERSSRGSVAASVTDIQMQERTDGADVAALLQLPNENDEFEEELQKSHNAFEIELKEPADELFTRGMSAAEKAEIEKIRRSFAPQAADLQAAASTERTAHNFDWPALLPEDATKETIQQLITQWHDTLNVYVDTVWGREDPFRPFPERIQEAKEAIETVKKEEAYEDKQAVRRLNQILRHLKS